MDDEQLFRLQLAYNRARKRYEEADRELEKMASQMERLANAFGRQKLGSHSRRSPVQLKIRKPGFMPTEAEAVETAERLNVAAVEMLEAWNKVPTDNQGECNPLPHNFQSYDWDQFSAARNRAD